MAYIQVNGIYTLINLKGGTSMDLSGGDNTSIIGFLCHGGPNQSWTFESAGQGIFYLKSVRTGKYLAPAGNLLVGQSVIARDSPFAWRVEDVQGKDSCVRLFPAEDTRFVLSLSNHGSPTPGTPIWLWGNWRGEGENLIWRLQKRC